MLSITPVVLVPGGGQEVVLGMRATYIYCVTVSEHAGARQKEACCSWWTTVLFLCVDFR